VTKSFIRVEDNFFENNKFEEIKEYVDTLNYNPPQTSSIEDNKGCYWFEKQLERGHDLQNLIINILKDRVNLNIDKDYKSKDPDTLECVTKFIMSNAQDGARPHTDNCQIQCLIFLKGEEILNNGTMFVDKNTKSKEVSFDIHTHIGFKENRAIVFSSDNWHTPAQFLGGTWRYSIANFFNLKST
tara:strand:- start:49 stop:603 length:555 start_codon:yes stop_codon:yes gene_type:complete